MLPSTLFSLPENELAFVIACIREHIKREEKAMREAKG